MEKTWSGFLDESGLCKEDSLTGNRPCDNGRLCGSCRKQKKCNGTMKPGE